MRTIAVRLEARRDIDGIFVRIAADNFDAAIRVDDAIIASFHLLAENPSAGARCEFPQADVADLRFWPVKRYPDYLVIYRPLADGIDVVRVIHGAMDMDRVIRGA
jgi:toxin ParE1/3/4